MFWGTDGKQDRYKATRKATPKVVSIADIQGVCKKCGYVELKPTSEFESANGGLMVERASLVVKNEKGEVIQKLRNSATRKLNYYWGCNHCINNW